jgi:hypothetical protein
MSKVKVRKYRRSRDCNKDRKKISIRIKNLARSIDYKVKVTFTKGKVHIRSISPEDYNIEKEELLLSLIKTKLLL